MSDIHIRALLLIVIAMLGCGAAVGLKFLGATGWGLPLLMLLGIAALAGAIVMLLIAEEPAGSPQERRE